MSEDLSSDEPRPADLPSQDSLGAQLEAFRRNPRELSLFRKLGRQLRKETRGADLAELLELRAPVEENQKEASRQWLDAANLRLSLGEHEAAFCDFRRLLLIEPAHPKASRQYVDALISNQAYSEAASVMEVELSSLEKQAGVLAAPSSLLRRIAERSRLLAEIWEEQLGRLDKALQCWKRSFQLEPSQPRALNRARDIYQSLGNQAMVRKLYESELQLLGPTGDRSRRAIIELAIGELLQKGPERDLAARHLERALQLAPESLQAREALAQLLATSENAEALEFSSELFVELGNQRRQTGNTTDAIHFLKSALSANPRSAQAGLGLEGLLHENQRWSDLDRLYVSRLDTCESDSERSETLWKRAQLCEDHLDSRENLKNCLRQLVDLHASGSEFLSKLKALHEEDREGQALADLLQAQLASCTKEPEARVALLLELAGVYRDTIEDPDRAAEILHQVLALDPVHREALDRYSEHFRSRRDWRGLADLKEYSIEQLRTRGAAPQELAERLESLAALCERRLGDLDRALRAWRRIEEITGPSAKTNDSKSRLLSHARTWESLVGVLQQEAEQASSPTVRVSALRRLAQLYREQKINPYRSIQIYEEVLGLFPEDDGTLQSLAELYDQEGDSAGLSRTLKRQLDLAARRHEASVPGSGGRERASWPVAKRVQRVAALRRVAKLYEIHLADVEGVVYACSGILELLPGDREALERMERVLEKAGDTERLERTLEYHIASSATPAERCKLLRRYSGLAEDRNDEVAAMSRWEQLLNSAPSDKEALGKLADLYLRHQRFQDLADILEKWLRAAESPAQGSAEASALVVLLKRHARVLELDLQDAPRATQAWQRVLALDERDRDALEALSRLQQASEQWRDLVKTLNSRVELHLDQDRELATKLALQRIQILEGHLASPELAITALETLLGRVDPSSLEAHKRLRGLYEARGLFAASIKIAERQMLLCQDPEWTAQCALEIGSMCRERLRDPHRALQAYDRVLAQIPEHPQALIAAGDLCAQVGHWRKHATVLETLEASCTQPSAKRDLMLRIAETYSEHLGDHLLSFHWRSRAHRLSPDAQTLASLWSAAEKDNLWKELAELLETSRDQLREHGAILDPQTFVRLCKDISEVCDQHLGDPKRAIDALYEALTVAPQDLPLMFDAERIAQDSNQNSVWVRLIDCLSLPLAVVTGEEATQFHLRAAHLYEKHAKDRDSAMRHILGAFSASPSHGGVRDALYGFGDRNRKYWQEILSTETALAERSSDVLERVSILRRKAIAYEERAGDTVRAYRTHLSAFLLAPDNEEGLAHLWRLAQRIGTYSDSHRVPEAELPPAPISNRVPRGAAKKARREATQELTLSDLLEGESFAGDGNCDLATAIVAPSGITTATIRGRPTEDGESGGSAAPAGSPTQQLDLDDLFSAQPRHLQDASINLRTGDLIDALAHSPATATTPPPRRSAGERRAGECTTGQSPPPPPTRRPAIRPSAKTENREIPRSTPAQGMSRGNTAWQPNSKIPTSPKNAYSSAWSELAFLYCNLPAANLAGRLRWHFRAAEVWERGARKTERAFDVLATALRCDPANPETRERLFALAKAHRDWKRLADLYTEAASAARSSETASEFLLEVATIRITQGQREETESLYRRILGMHPDHRRARQELAQLYREQERWIDLAAQLEERTDPRLGSTTPSAQRPALLRELAVVYSEKLGRPHDSIESLERLLEIEPGSQSVLSEIALAYEKLGKWSKCIEALARLCDIAQGQTAACRARSKIAKLYETKLKLPDRAMEAYARLLVDFPGEESVSESLDKLYQRHGRWQELALMLQQRISHEREPARRAKLLHRRARIILQWLSSPDEAASILRQAHSLTPEDLELEDDFVLALLEAKREREASTLLQQRILKIRAVSAHGNASTGDIAALLIRLGIIRADALSDSAGAREVLEEALTLVPAHPTALATLARLTNSASSPKAHAEAKMREARATTDVEAKIRFLFDAGRSFRDAGNLAQARQAFEDILAERSFDAGATWELAALAKERGDFTTAIGLLEARLQAESIDSQERAQVLTQLAALSRNAGMEAAAEQRLTEALQHAPSYAPAILSLAEVLAVAKRWEDSEEFLVSVLPRIEESSHQIRAEILRRLATTCDALGNSDAAYQRLLSADRLCRDNLNIKLALGENRYHARRWREAALHLSSLSEHPDVSSSPSEVAAGLYHAALAEVRSRHPEKAEALYRSALALKSDFGPALQALAEIEMNRGETAKATALLARHAQGSHDPIEKRHLYESLGDLHFEQLKNSEAAQHCYEMAISAAQPLDSKHMPLLKKLLARLMANGRRDACGRTCSIIASFTSDAEKRCEQQVEAAVHWRSAGSLDEARAAADQATAAAPYNLVACDMASQFAMEAGDPSAAAAILGRLLNHNDGLGAGRDKRVFSQLWSRLASARLARGDAKNAEQCYEKSLALSPSSKGAVEARRGLIELLGEHPNRREDVRELRRTLAKMTLQGQDIAEQARGEYRSGHIDGGHCGLELATVLGYHYDDGDVAFLARHTSKIMAQDEAYKSCLARKYHLSLITDDDDEPLATVSEILWQSAALLWPSIDVAFARSSVTEATRISSTKKLRAAVIFTRLSRAMSAPATILYKTTNAQAPDVQIVCVSPPAVIFGPRLWVQGQSSTGEVADLELRFLLARAAELLSPTRIIAAGLPAEDWQQLVSALQRIFGKPKAPEEAGKTLGAADSNLRKTLPVKARSRLKAILGSESSLQASGTAEKFLAASERAADRAGLLLCGDIDLALRHAVVQDDQGHLLRMPLQEDYLEAREQLGIGASKR